MGASELPGYSPSTDVPDYVEEPQEDEQRLEFVERIPASSGQGVNFRYRSGGITLTLQGLQAGTNVPTFARDAVVQGRIETSEEDVRSVAVKLEGKQSVTVYLEDTLTAESTLFSNVHDLWKKQGSGTCPSELSFSIPFPTAYKDKDRTLPLPSSFRGAYRGGPTIFAFLRYSVTVVVSKKRFASWEKQKTLSQVIAYRPRSRAPLAIPRNPPVVISADQIHTDWQDIASSMPARGSGFGPIECHFFVPKAQTFAITDSIPFSLHLRAPVDHLDKLLGSTTSDTPGNNDGEASTSRALPSPTTTPTSPKGFLRNPVSRLANIVRVKDAGEPKFGVRVYLERRLGSEIYGQLAWQSREIGEAELTKVAAQNRAEAGAYVWTGEARCRPLAVSVGGFSTSAFTVKDSIVLVITPVDQDKSPWATHKYTHPIKLVTDPYQTEL
ncbi:hypothetical protein BDW22DRAFT_1354442 [Trametopsis cervina]|nr:hypothetical protein BDW22DRAFT_1354442 [Trametopsis cervina]